MQVIKDLEDSTSIELNDCLIDEHLLNDLGHSQKNDDKKSLDAGNSHNQGVIGRIIRHFTEKSLVSRIEEYESNELKVFIAQKLFKVDGILCDEQSRLVLIDTMILKESQINENEINRKYGTKMGNWLRDRLVPSVADCSSVLKKAALEFNRYKKDDILCNWFRQPPSISANVAARIAKFATSMTSRVKCSILMEPGKFTCHLTEFLSEYHRLELICMNELSPEEKSQDAFDLNYITKSRSKHIQCIDSSRVILRDGEGKEENWHDVSERIFPTLELEPDNNGKYGSGDFIHASHVRGGPLLNSFICTQAPLDNTQIDFWRMVCQEKCGMIVMLSDAVDTSSVGLLSSENTSIKSHCSFYWPRLEGDSLWFGNIHVKNISIDNTSDPLFTITYLEIQQGGDDPFVVEHWQWDWNFMGDVYWPLRILRRARLSSKPTIIQCLDGCAKSGTLVAIETVLMSFIKGSPIDDSLVLLASCFARLQRRHAVGSSLHYLFIYRCILHFISPYVTSTYERLFLGLLSPSIGFIPKYDDMIRDQSK